MDEPEPETLNGTTADAVAAATGHRWGHWLRTLDSEGAQDMTHAEIARHLSARHGLSSWWCQQVTVAYEKARGRRRLHQRPDGYEIGVSRTMALPEADARRLIEARLDAWELSKRPGKGKVVRADAPVGRVAFSFDAKGPGKTTVTATHGKLPDAQAAAAAKGVWRERLDTLKS